MNEAKLDAWDLMVLNEAASEIPVDLVQFDQILQLARIGLAELRKMRRPVPKPRVKKT